MKKAHGSGSVDWIGIVSPSFVPLSETWTYTSVPGGPNANRKMPVDVTLRAVISAIPPPEGLAVTTMQSTFATN